MYFHEPIIERQKKNMTLTILTQAAGYKKIPNLDKKLQKSAKIILAHLPAQYQKLSQNCTFTLLLTTNSKIQGLNHDFRGQNKPTNVLSFPQFSPQELKKFKGLDAPTYLGDIAIAYQYTAAEAKAEHKPLINHLTHLLIHGILHLLGYDHQTESAAKKMERLEKEIMAILGLPDPYQELAPPPLPKSRKKKPL